MTGSGSPRSAVKFRPARASDLDALDALERAIFKSPLFSGHLISRASFRRFLGLASAGVIIAEVDGKLAGYVLVLYRANSATARLYSIGVGAEFRRRGLARRLSAAAESDAIRRRRERMQLEVRADDRGAIALYETAGYRPCGRRPGYYGGRVDALRLAKALRKKPRRHS